MPGHPIVRLLSREVSSEPRQTLAFAWLVARRSIGRQAFFVFVGMAVARIVLRGFGWVYEWRWWMYQYAFLSIFLVPTAAGVATWEALRWQRAVDGPQVAGRSTASAVASAAGLLWWVVLAYAVGGGVVVAIVKAHHVPGWPGIVDGVVVHLPRSHSCPSASAWAPSPAGASRTRSWSPPLRSSCSPCSSLRTSCCPNEWRVSVGRQAI